MNHPDTGIQLLNQKKAFIYFGEVSSYRKTCYLTHAGNVLQRHDQAHQPKERGKKEVPRQRIKHKNKTKWKEQTYICLLPF